MDRYIKRITAAITAAGVMFCGTASALADNTDTSSSAYGVTTQNLLADLTENFAAGEDVAYNRSVYIKVADSQEQGFLYAQDEDVIEVGGREYTSHYQSGGTNVNDSKACTLDGDNKGSYRESLEITAYKSGTLTIDCTVNDTKIAAIATVDSDNNYTSVDSVNGKFINDTGAAVYKTLTAELETGDVVRFIGKGTNVPIYGIYYEPKSSQGQADVMYIGASVDGNRTCTIDPYYIGKTINVDVDVIMNPGINNATFFIHYNPNVIRAKCGGNPQNADLARNGYIYYTKYNSVLMADENLPFIKNSLMDEQIAYIPRAGSIDYENVNADGVKTAAELGKVKLESTVYDAGGGLKQINCDGKLFSMTFDVIGEGNTDLYIEVIKFGGIPDPTYDNTIKTSTITGTILVGGGDVNADGAVTYDDAKEILMYVAGIKQIDRSRYQYADFNQNGSVDIGDAIAILAHIE